MSATKQCSACRQHLPLDLFSPRQSKCAPCRSAARREARRRQNDTSAGRVKAARDENRKLHRARDAVRAWTKELDQLEQFFAVEVERQLADLISRQERSASSVRYTREQLYRPDNPWQAPYEGLELSRTAHEKQARRETVRKLIAQKYAEFGGDLSTDTEKAAGCTFDARMETAPRTSYLDHLVHEFLGEAQHERMVALRDETEEQRAKRYETLREHRLRDLAFESEEHREDVTHLYERAHHEGLKAAERCNRPERKADEYRRAKQAHIDLHLLALDPTKQPLYRPRPEDAATVAVELAEHREREVARVREYFKSRSD